METFTFKPYTGSSPATSLSGRNTPATQAASPPAGLAARAGNSQAPLADDRQANTNLSDANRAVQRDAAIVTRLAIKKPSSKDSDSDESDSYSDSDDWHLVSDIESPTADAPKAPSVIDLSKSDDSDDNKESKNAETPVQARAKALSGSLSPYSSSTYGARPAHPKDVGNATLPDVTQAMLFDSTAAKDGVRQFLPQLRIERPTDGTAGELEAGDSASEDLGSSRESSFTDDDVIQVSTKRTPSDHSQPPQKRICQRKPSGGFLRHALVKADVEWEWEIDKILNVKVVRGRGMLYFVQWKPTWEPAASLFQADEALEKFYRRYPHKPRPRSGYSPLIKRKTPCLSN